MEKDKKYRDRENKKTKKWNKLQAEKMHKMVNIFCYLFDLKSRRSMSHPRFTLRRR